MIYTCLNGRLGNCLFEIAAGVSLAKKLGVSYKALICDYRHLSDLQIFRKSILSKIDFQDVYPENVTEYNETGSSYEMLPLQDNLLLNGYFQSEKYFDKDLVYDLFKIDEITEKYIRDNYGFIFQRKTVAINVRRGDYLKLEYRHPVCRMSYFNKAISYFDKTMCFLVISDDIEWCKTHFKGDNFYFVENEPPLIDLYLQSMCTHNIISNSTFSWWGAWLNPNPDKKVLYPDPWFGFCLKNKKRFNTSDLCPKNWIPVPFGEFDYYFYGGRSYIYGGCRYINNRYSYTRDRLKRSISSLKKSIIRK